MSKERLDRWDARARAYLILSVERKGDMPSRAEYRARWKASEFDKAIMRVFGGGLDGENIKLPMTKRGSRG